MVFGDIYVLSWTKFYFIGTNVFYNTQDHDWILGHLRYDVNVHHKHEGDHQMT